MALTQVQQRTAAPSAQHIAPVKRVTMAKPEELHVPAIAWPTVMLFTTSTLLWALTIFVGFKFDVYWLYTLPICIACIFCLFTPLHDSVHMAVSSKHRALNTIIGRLSGFFFLAPYPAFRYVHLQHHKFTNDPDHDPDYWSGEGPKFLLPLRWMCQELHYYIPYLGNLLQRPFWERVEALSTLFISYSVVIKLFIAGYGWPVFVYFLLPMRIAVMFLAYTFDYIPHRPHEIKSQQDPYRSTSKVDGIFSVGDGSSDKLSWILLYQTYHNIHHLYPMLPFYRYKGIWDNHKEELLKLGNPLAPFFAH
eukprot:GILJ01009037.1.p1 GENE.GILJ01009037.1~~GILJ01009037.1.p1  ORF type:complete len:334 (-),score=18.15 GILJ01009037.1:192-1109(-)